MQDNSRSEARDRGEPASTNSTEESRQDRRAKRTVGVENKLRIRKVADTGYSREERERRLDGGARKRGVHMLPGTCVEKI